MATMKWFLLFVLLVILVAVVIAALRRGEARWPGPTRSDAGRSRTVKCLRCHGTGWIGREPERTLNFTGDGFEDRHAPATMCSACGGTGVIERR